MPPLYSAFEHDPEKWHRFSEKIMLRQQKRVTLCQFDKRASDPY
jgi:hypothetical protein